METSKKILIIDDDLTIRLVLKKIFNKYFNNIDIFTSEDGVQGIGYAFVINPDLIIIDSTLPKYSGRELVDFISNNEIFQLTPVILIHESDSSVFGLPRNFIQLSKKDTNFTASLISILDSKIGNADSKAHINKNKFAFTKYIGEKIIKFANRSTIVTRRIKNGNILTNIFRYIHFLTLQIITGLFLTIFYILAGKKDKEANINQYKKDQLAYRTKVYPAIGATLALVIFTGFQIFAVIAGIFSVGFFGTEQLFAASYTWDGGGLTNNWSDCDNWSTNVCPDTADTVTFNSTSTKDSNIDGAWTGTVTSITISTGYTGTITQQRSVTVSSTFSTSDGTYTAAGQTLSIAGAFTMNTGSTFTASSGTTTFSANFTINGGTFNHNSGTVRLDGGAATLSCNSVTFNLVVVDAGTNNKVVGTNCTLPLGNNPTITRLTLNPGAITGSGTITETASGGLDLRAGASVTGFSGLITTALTVNGATIDFSSYSVFTAANTVNVSAGSLSLPSGSDLNGGLTFSGGTFTAPSGNMTLAGNLNITNSPTFNHNNGTITFDGSTASLTCNSVTFNQVIFNNTSTKTVNTGCTLPLGANPSIPAAVNLSGTLSGTGTLSTSGTFTFSSGGAFSGFSGFAPSILTVAGGDANFGSLTTFTASGNVTLNSGTLTLPSGADLNSTSQTIALQITGGTFNAPSGNMFLAGGLTISGAPTFNHNNGTVTFDGGTATLSCNNVTFNLVSFTGQTLSKTVESNCSLPLGTDPSIPYQIHLNGVLSGSGTLFLESITDLNFYAGSSISGFSAIDMLDGADITVDGGDIDLTGYTITMGSGELRVASGSLTVPDGAHFNDLELFGGTLNAPSGTLLITGTILFTGGTFNHNNGTVIISGGVRTITCNNATFNLISFSGQTGTKTISSDCTLPLGSNPTIPNSIVLNGVLSGTGTLTQTTGTLTLNAGANITGFSGYTGTTNTLTVSGATIDLSSLTTVFSINGTTSVSSGTITLPNGTDLNGTLEISGGTFNAPSGVMTLANALTITGSPTFNANGGTISIDATSTMTLSCNNVTFSKIELNQSNTATVGINADCNIPLGNNPTTTGPLRLQGANSTVSGTGTFTSTCNNSNCLRITSGTFSGFTGLVMSGGLRVDGGTLDLSDYTTVNLTTGTGNTSSIDVSSGTLIAPTGILMANKNIVILGGTFTHNGGTVQLTGGDQTLFGDITFNNLTKTVSSASTLTFPASNTQTILGTLTLKGTSGNVLSLRSSIEDTEWNIDAQGTEDVEYLDIKDSNNIGTTIQAGGKNVINSGNNTGWNFDAPILSNLAPENLITSGFTNDTTPTFTFTTSHANLSETVLYNIQIDNDENFGTAEVDFTSSLETLGDKTFTVSAPLADDSYYFRIRLTDSIGITTGYEVANDGEIAFNVDTTNPTGQIFTSYVTNSTNPNIHIISSTSDTFGVTEMMYSESSIFSGGTYVVYNPLINYTLSSGYGQKTIYVKFKDAAGNESTTYSSTISYTAPTQVVNNGNLPPTNNPTTTPTPTTPTTPTSSPVTPTPTTPDDDDDGTEIPVNDGEGKVLTAVALKIVDQNGDPVSNVRVALSGSSSVEYTNEFGIVVFNRILVGKATVTVEYAGKTYTKEINVEVTDRVTDIVLGDEIVQPSNNNLIFLSIILVVILIGIILFLITRRYKQKQIADAF